MKEVWKNRNLVPQGIAMEYIDKGDYLAIEPKSPSFDKTVNYNIRKEIEKENKIKDTQKEKTAIQVKCPYCLNSQSICILPDQPTVIVCDAYGCYKSYLVELENDPIIHISEINWEIMK